MFWATLRIIDGNSRMVLLTHTLQGLFQQQVRRQGENIRPRDHDFARGEAVEFEHAVNHIFLEFGNLPEAAAGGHDEFEFVRGMDGALPRASRSERPEHYPRGAACEE